MSSEDTFFTRHKTLVTGLVVFALTSAAWLALGIWAVRQEQARTVKALEMAEANLERAMQAEAVASANLEQAEANLKLAKQAVDECFNIAKEHKVFQQPHMAEAKKLLLQATLPFYKQLREQNPAEDGRREREAERKSNDADP